MNFIIFSEPKILIDNPSPPLDLEGPFNEFEFKPIINPPPGFYDLKPVQVNPFHNDDIVLSAPGFGQDLEITQPRRNVQAADILDEDIDVISAPDLAPAYEEDVPPPIPDYGEVKIDSSGHDYVL